MALLFAAFTDEHSKHLFLAAAHPLKALCGK